jgi:predicted nuclease of predicted toxin-antitoxin system
VRFLADESCDFGVVRVLRAAGFDAAAVAEITPRATDDAVIDLASRAQQLLLTEDKDFGRLVHAGAHPSAGVILIRFPSSARLSLPQVVLDLVRERGPRLTGSFTVVQPGRVRIPRASRE